MNSSREETTERWGEVGWGVEGRGEQTETKSGKQRQTGRDKHV